MTPHPQRCETCNPKCADYLVIKKQERIFNQGHSKDWEYFTSLKGCASHSNTTGRDKVLVYSRLIKPLINFPCITRRELALKDFENNDEGQSWSSLNFKLENGDEIRVYRTPTPPAGDHP